MKILITGSTGFIGNHLTRAFVKKYTVFHPTHHQLDLFDAAKVETYIRKHHINVIIHAAVVGGAGSTYFTPDMLRDNLRMFYHVARCRPLIKKIIFIGSGAVYDKRFPIAGARKEDFCRRIPADEYGLYKYICSDYIQNHDGLIDLRVFGIFGEGEDPRRFISSAICRMLAGKPITINQNVVFDYLDIEDFVKIVEFFLSHKQKYSAYNAGSGRKVDLVTIAKKVMQLDSQQKNRILVAKRGLGNEYTGNTGRLQREMKEFQPTALEYSIAGAVSVV